MTNVSDHHRDGADARSCRTRRVVGQITIQLIDEVVRVFKIHGNRGTLFPDNDSVVVGSLIDF